MYVARRYLPPLNYHEYVKPEPEKCYKMIMSLTEFQFKIMVDVYFRNKTYKELIKKYNISWNFVGIQIQAIKKKLEIKMLIGVNKPEKELFIKQVKNVYEGYKAYLKQEENDTGQKTNIE